MKEGKFRLDLMCRLKSVHIHLPPLRERDGDIPHLAEHFFAQACERYQKPLRGFSPAAMEVLMRKELPGNIRSLIHEVENAVLLADGELIEPQHLGASEQSVPLAARTLCSLKEDHFRQVAFVMAATGGDTGQAAKILGISVRQVQRLMLRIREQPWSRGLFEDAGA
jgi:DNA-binding NtrC family response regulator